MNTECYTTEYRQCLSPKGQLYLKADSEGKPYLTFNHHFRQEPCIIMPYVSHTHTHTYVSHTHNHEYHKRADTFATFTPIVLCYILTRSVCPLSRYCTLEAATACLLAFSRSDFNYETAASRSCRANWRFSMESLWPVPSNRYESKLKECCSRTRITYTSDSSVLFTPSPIVSRVPFDTNGCTGCSVALRTKNRWNTWNKFVSERGSASWICFGYQWSVRALLPTLLLASLCFCVCCIVRRDTGKLFEFGMYGYRLKGVL